MFIALQVRHVTLLNGSSADLHLCVSAVMTHTHTHSLTYIGIHTERHSHVIKRPRI